MAVLWLRLRWNPASFKDKVVSGIGSSAWTFRCHSYCVIAFGHVTEVLDVGAGTCILQLGCSVIVLELVDIAQS